MEKLLDPYLIDSCWSTEDAIDWSEPSDRSDEIKSLRSLRAHLSADDKELYSLLYIKKKTQCEVADILYLTQPTISYRVEQLTKTLQFLAFKPKLDRRVVNYNLSLLSKNRRKYLESFLVTPNQVHVAEQFGVSPSNISKALSAILNDDGLDMEFINYIMYLKTAPSLVFLS